MLGVWFNEHPDCTDSDIYSEYYVLIKRKTAYIKTAQESLSQNKMNNKELYRDNQGKLYLCGQAG